MVGIYTCKIIEEIGAAVRTRTVSDHFTNVNLPHTIQGLSSAKTKEWWKKLDGMADTLHSMLGVDNLVWGGHTMYISPDAGDTQPTADMGLIAAHVFGHADINNFDGIFCGEMDGNGNFIPLRNPISVGREAKKQNMRLFCPRASSYMAQLSGCTVVPIANVVELYDVLLNGAQTRFHIPDNIYDMSLRDSIDMKYIRGQHIPKFALEVAVAGQHNILFGGSQGTGKSLLAKAIPTIMPPMSQEEIVEVSALWQAAGKTQSLVPARQVRFVDPSVTKQALIGGGTEAPVIGEVTLAHRGVLFLDEFLQFSPSVLEALRSPIQDGVVTLSRVAWKAEFPCNFMMVAATNLCKCGHYGHPTKPCTCTKSALKLYQSKFSGPLLDRIAIRMHVQPLTPDELFSAEEEESSEFVKSRVLHAREIQQERYNGSPLHSNNDIGAAEINSVAIDNAALVVLKSYSTEKCISARSMVNILKVARTVADLAGTETITKESIEKTIDLLFNIDMLNADV